MPKSPHKHFNWKAKNAEKALKLVFEGRWTREEVAAKCSVSERTLYYWLEHPEFQARLEQLRSDFAARQREIAYGEKVQRLIGFSQMAESARREYEERPWLKEVRPSPFGDVTNESFNSGAFNAFCKGLAEIAAELGERKNVTELSATLEVKNDADAFERRLAGILERATAADVPGEPDAG